MMPANTKSTGEQTGNPMTKAEKHDEEIDQVQLWIDLFAKVPPTIEFINKLVAILKKQVEENDMVSKEWQALSDVLGVEPLNPKSIKEQIRKVETNAKRFDQANMEYQTLGREADQLRGGLTHITRLLGDADNPSRLETLEDIKANYERRMAETRESMSSKSQLMRLWRSLGG